MLAFRSDLTLIVNTYIHTYRTYIHTAYTVHIHAYGRTINGRKNEG